MRSTQRLRFRFSALQRAEIAEIATPRRPAATLQTVSVLFNEPKLLKSKALSRRKPRGCVSVLFNEPKLLKSSASIFSSYHVLRFSALQRAEIAEMAIEQMTRKTFAARFSALQRAEIAEI